MHLSTGLRIARVRSPFIGNGFCTLVPLAAANKHQLQQRRQQQQLQRLTPYPSRTAVAPRRAASTASQTKQAPKSTSELVSSERVSSPLPASTTLNPPASTRPPPLDLPKRDPGISLFKHLWALGKAYMTFYKTGVQAIIVNWRLLSRSPTASAPRPAIPGSTSFPTRSDVLLRARTTHDLSLLPVFGLLLIVCGELTPLVVVAFPRLTPFTCRIPAQAAALRRSTEARRAASFRALKYRSPPVRGSDPAAAGHVCRVLGLTSPLWDRVGLDSPFAGSVARRAVARIAADDAMIREGGGAGALVDEEVVLACEDRGIDVLDQPVDKLRSQLEEWLRETAPKGDAATSKEAAQKEAEDKVKEMLVSLDGRV